MGRVDEQGNSDIFCLCEAQRDEAVCHQAYGINKNNKEVRHG
jgi:hypothetical protein